MRLPSPSPRRSGPDGDDGVLGPSPHPSLLRRTENEGTGGQLVRARGTVRSARSGSPGRAARPGPGFAFRHADGDAGPASRETGRSCSRGCGPQGFLRRQSRSGRRRGRPRAGEASARARPTGRPSASPRAHPPPPGGAAGGPDRRRWGAHRGAVGTASHPVRSRGRERSGRAPDASGPRRWSRARSRRDHDDRAHPTRSHLRAVTAHAAPTARVAPAPPRTERNARCEGASTPPQVHVRIVVRRSLVLGTTPGTSFAGVHGSEGGHPARRDARRPGDPSLDEVSMVSGRRQTVRSRHRRSLPAG